jgi:ubiquinone/menaquinone biosynthesis C-methylase UbiE
MPGDAGLAREQVPAAFDTDAGVYDRLVAANPGYHANLRRSAAWLGIAGTGAGLHLLDAGCGTGASTAALHAMLPAARITGIDASAAMLEAARAKQWPDTVTFVHAPVEKLADAELDGPFDGILAAYLLRNLADPDGALEALRTRLRAGAKLAVHEFSVRDSVRACLTWHAVCWGIIIPAGRLAAGDARLYRYLWRSALAFDGSAEFRARLRRAGFTGVCSTTMPGWQRGIEHTFVGEAPRVPS